MTKKQEILVEWMNGAACSKHKNFSGPITCDVCLLGSFGEIFLSQALDEYLSEAIKTVRESRTVGERHGLGIQEENARIQTVTDLIVKFQSQDAKL